MTKLKDMASSNQKQNACFGKIIIVILLLISSSFTSVYAQCPTISGFTDRDTICESDVFYIFSGISVSEGSILWSGGSDDFVSTNIANPTYYPGIDESGEVVLTMTVSSTTCSDDVIEEMTLFIQPEPIVYAGNDTIVCKGSTVRIEDATTSLPDNVTWTREGFGDFNSANLPRPTYTPHENDYANGGVTLIMTVTATDPCSEVYTDTMEIIFIAPPTAGIVNDDTICESDAPYTFSGISVSEGSILWETTGDGEFDQATITKANPTYYPMDELGDVNLTMTVSNSPCTPITRSMTLTIQPEPTVSAGNDTIVCQGSDVYIENATKSLPDNITWTSSGKGSFNNPTLTNPTYEQNASNYDIGSVTLTMTATTTTCSGSYTDEMEVTFIAPPTAGIVNDDAICESDDSYIFSGISVSEGSILWSGGSDNFSGEETANPTYYPETDESGEVVLTMTVSNSPCTPITRSMTLTFQPEPIVDAGNDTIVCQGSDVDIENATQTHPSTVAWTHDGKGSFNDSTLTNPIYEQDENNYDNGSVTLTMTATAIDPCSGSSSDDMDITFIAPPTAGIVNDATICESKKSYVFSGISVSVGSIAWTTTGTGEFGATTTANPTYYPMGESGNVVLTMTVSNSPCTPITRPMTLTIQPEPIVNAGADISVCQGSDVYIYGTTNYIDGEVTWTSSGDGSFNGDHLLEPTYTPSNIDYAGVTLTITGEALTPCSEPKSDAMMVTFIAPPTADAGDDATICLDDYDYKISSSSYTNGTKIFWTSDGDGTFDDPRAIFPTYSLTTNDRTSGGVNLTLTVTSSLYYDECLDAPQEEDVMRLTILSSNLTPVVDVGGDKTLCGNDGYSLVSATAENSPTLEWTTSSTTGGYFSNPTLLNPVYYPGSDDITTKSVTLTLTATGCSGSEVEDEMILTIAPLPTISMSNVTICETDIFNTRATVENASSFLWTSSTTTGTPGKFTNENSLNTTYTPSDTEITNGYAILTLTAYGDLPTECGGNEASRSMTLKIIGEPVIEAGSDVEICESGFTVSGVTGDATTYSTILWTSSGSPGTLENKATLSPTYTPSAADIDAGLVYLRVTASPASSCSTDDTDSIMVSINKAPVVSAGQDSTICEGINYDIPGATSDNYSSLGWTAVTGSGTFLNQDRLNATYRPVYADITLGHVKLILTAQPKSGSPCTSESDDVILSFQELPSVDAGPTTVTICEGETYLTEATASNHSDPTWTHNSTNGFFNDSTKLEAEYTPGSEGSVTLRLTADGLNECSSTSVYDEIKLIIDQDPIANAGPIRDTICETGSYTTTDATALYGGEVLWEVQGDDFGTFTNPTNLIEATYNPNSNAIANGSVTLRLTVYDKAACSAEPHYDDIIITFINEPVISITTPSSTWCEGISYLVNASGTTDANSVSWTTSGDGTFSNAAIVSPTYTPSTADAATGFVTLTLTADAISSCSPATKTITFPVVGIPTVDVGLTNDTICAGGDQYTLSEASASNQLYVLWTSSGDGTFSDAAIVNPEYRPSTDDEETGSVDLTFTVTGDDACTNPPPETMTLSFTPAPTADAGADAITCAGEDYKLSGASASNQLSVLWTTYGDGTLADETTLTPTYTPGASLTDVELIITVTGTGSCDNVSDTMTLSFTPAPTAYAGADDTICEGKDYTLSGVDATNYKEISWTHNSTNGSFYDNTKLEPRYTPSDNDLTNGEVELIINVTGSGGCIVSDTMTLSFTPAPTSDAGADAIICEGEDYINTDANPSDYTSLLWETTGDGKFGTTSDKIHPTYSPGSDDKENGTVTLRLNAYADGNNVCTDAVSVLTLQINKFPTAYAGADTIICEGLNKIQGASAENYSSLFWTIISGNGTLTNKNKLVPTYKPDEYDIGGSVEIQLIAVPNEPCTDSAFSTLTLSVLEEPTVDVIPNDSVCGTTFSLFGTTGNAEEYQWSSSGTGRFSVETILGPYYYPSEEDVKTGAVTLTLTGSSASCTDATDYMTLTLQSAPEIDAGADSTVCVSGSYTANPIITGDYAGILWRQINGAGQLIQKTSLTPTYIPDADEVGQTITLIMTVAKPAPCTDSVSHSMSLLVKAAPIASLGNDTIICEDEIYEVIGAEASNYSNIYWTTSGDGEFTVSGLSPTYVPGKQDIINGHADLSIHAVNTPCTEAVATMKLSFSDLPLVDAGSDATVDIGASFTVSNASVSDASSFFWTTPGRTGLFENENDTIHNVLFPIYTPSGVDFGNGSVQLTLTATPSGVCTTPVTDYMILTVTNHPPVDFTWLYSCEGTDTEFLIDTDVTDVDAIATYYWYFGDGNSSDSPEPLHTFETAGTYITTLTVTDTVGYTNIVWHYVEVNELPYANFSVDGPSCNNLATQFTDHSTYPSGYIVEWNWSFGDGNDTTIYFGGIPDVTHTFANSGTYYVSLTVKSSDSCVNAASQRVVVTAAPIARFSYADTCFGEITSFTDESVKVDGIDIISWTWNFGDSNSGIDNTSTRQNPTHVFSGTGTYAVILQVENTQGCIDTITNDVIVRELPAIDFTITDNCLNSAVEFAVNTTVTTTANIETYLWNFGDGITSTEPNPSHTYPVDGTYTITLTVTDVNGCTNSVSHELILAPLPISLFGVSESQCLSDAIEFTNYSTSASGYIVGCIWDFGDGSTSTIGFPDNTSHIYNASGTYSATLTVTNSNGCSNTSTQEVTIQPEPIASFGFESACLGVSTNFTNSSQPNGGGTIVSWDWDFDDLTSGIDNTSTLQNPSHVFSTVGEHLVQLTVTNESGCSSTDASTITVTILSDIDFEAVGGTCLDEEIEFFIDKNLLDPRDIQWDFGDGSSSNDTQPIYTYQNAGTYTITLTIVDINGCTNSISKDVYIDQLPNVNFDTDAPSCEGNETFFNDLSSTSNFIKKWHWEFGDGTDSIIDWPDDQNISHIYESSGSYLAKLSITTDDGCRNTFEKQINIIPGPVAHFVATTVCIDHPAEFTDLSQENNAGVIVDWDWDFGDPISGINNTSSSQNPVHLYAVSETYPVILTVTNAEGCQSTYSDDIVVTIPPVIEPFTFNSPICENSIAEFQMSNNVNISGVLTIHWDFGDPNAVDNSSSDQSPTHTYVTPGEYIVTLTLDNDKCGGSVSDTINVLPVPQAQFESDNTCKDSPTQFTDLSFNTGSDIESWRWDFGITNLASDTSILQNPVYSYPETGSYDVQLVVTDGVRCSDTSDAIPIEIYPVPDAKFTFETNVEGIQGNIKLTNESVDATEYLWDFGDGGISKEADPPTHQYDASIITYEVDLVLISYNDYGCSDTAIFPYSLYFKGLFIPTAFSPSDYQTSMVRIFKPVGVNLEVFKVEVRDYWGNLMWETNALDDEGRPTEFWDGTLNGSKLPAGVYVWTANGIFKDGTVWEGKEMGSNEGGNGKTYGTVLLIQ